MVAEGVFIFQVRTITLENVARDELEGCYVDRVTPGFYLIRKASL